MAPGEMRAVMVTDENTGQKIREWVGPDSFVKAMGLPCRRVVRINRPAPAEVLYESAATKRAASGGW
jgi:hypothetical protein